MLPILVACCALIQPPAPSSPAAVTPAATGEKAAPTPLEELALKGMTDRLVGRPIGAYYTMRRFMEWIVEANAADADAVKKLREQWDAEMKPGFDALVHLMATRERVADDEIMAKLAPQLDKQLEGVKARLKPSDYHDMIVEERLNPRTQPAAAASYLYMFDPARAGNDMTLVAAGKIRKVQARLSAEGGPESVLEFSIPLSWNTVTDRPGALTVGENGGLGPLSVTVNGFALPKEGEHDPLKLMAVIAKKGRDPNPPVKPFTLAGHTGATASTVIVTPMDAERNIGLYTFYLIVNGERVVSTGCTVGAQLNASERDYTRAEFDTYAQSHKAVVEWVLGTMKLIDTPVTGPTAAPAPGATPSSSPSK